LMTSFAFIMGVVPLMLASGAGAEIRHALGTVVFAGMLGVTFFGLLLTPVFYVLIRRLTSRDEPGREPESPSSGGALAADIAGSDFGRHQPAADGAHG
jgi:gold/copper resistance efflux pump